MNMTVIESIFEFLRNSGWTLSFLITWGCVWVFGRLQGKYPKALFGELLFLGILSLELLITVLFEGFEFFLGNSASSLVAAISTLGVSLGLLYEFSDVLKRWKRFSRQQP